MVVGSLLICLRLPGAETLKDKRKVIHGLVEKLRRRFGVSAAEVDDLGLSGNATLGIAVVSGSGSIVESVLNSVIEFIESHAEIEIYDCRRDLDIKD